MKSFKIIKFPRCFFLLPFVSSNLSYWIHPMYICLQLVDSNGTLPETNSSHLKIDGWKTSLSFWGPAHFQVLCLLVSGRPNVAINIT